MMITYKQTLSKKEQPIIRSLLDSLEDVCNDFYITINNERIFLKEGKNYLKLFNILKRGDRIIYSENGILLVIGYSDKSPRKYLKILANNKDAICNLIKVLLWENLNIDLYAKFKKNNIAIEILKANGWQFYKSRGKEILLIRRRYARHSN